MNYQKKKPSKEEEKLKGYSWAEHEAAKMTYLLLGRDRSLAKIATYSGINVKTLEKWAKKEDWVGWVKTQEEIQNKLALRGMYDAGVLYLSEKANAVLEQVIDQGSKLLTKESVDIKGSDITMSARIMLELMKRMGTDQAEQGPDWPEDVTAKLPNEDEIIPEDDTE
jgi:hypothetical protein